MTNNINDQPSENRSSIRSVQLKTAKALSRRHALQAFSHAAAGTAFSYALSPLQANRTFATESNAGTSVQNVAPLNRFPRMVHEYFVRLVREADQKNSDRIASLSTRQEAEQYVEMVREKIQQSFGPFPERTPLNSRVTGIVKRDGYRIENIIFESRPGFPVTANLYLPVNRDGKLPGVVGTCGHSNNGKAAEAYQQFAQGLARLGFACLIYDPIGQGERLQYVNDALKSTKGAGVQEHLYGGNQQFLVGEFLGTWRAWDGIRALDYLLERPEIDPNRIGITGNSGGGTMTTWLTGVEQRWAMSAPSCFVTTFRRNMENELPADTEQCPPKAIALGLDHSDFLAALAPKPVIILAKERDYFDARGSEEAYRRLRKLYGLLGHPDQVALFVGPTGHGYSQENREAMYSWFSRSADKQSDSAVDGAPVGVLTSDATIPFVAEPELQIETDETLTCTPKGQVAALEGTRSIWEFTRDKSIELAAKRSTLRGDALKAAITDVLRLPVLPATPPDYRIWRHLNSRGYPMPAAVAYTVESEPGIQTICYRLTSERWYSRVPVAGDTAILYIAHLSSDSELREEPLIRDVMAAQPDIPFFACDVRGIGESMPDTCDPNSFHSAYGNDYFYAIHSLMLDRPYLGQKTFDVLRALQWLKSNGHTKVHLVAKGWGALCGTFASVLSDQVTQVTLKHALTSYSEIAQSRDYRWPLSALLPNVLEQFDLPDCYAQLEEKNLTQLAPATAEAGVH
ncbi:MAG: acetylxylan esterase [Planctomycetaceae bacterium]|nr:acetylxylan esterase [Planctomycetaceae bacterium]